MPALNLFKTALAVDGVNRERWFVSCALSFLSNSFGCIHSTSLWSMRVSKFRLLTARSVEGWSGPNAFSYPSNARRHIPVWINPSTLGRVPDADLRTHGPHIHPLCWWKPLPRGRASCVWGRQSFGPCKLDVGDWLAGVGGWLWCFGGCCWACHGWHEAPLSSTSRYSGDEGSDGGKYARRRIWCGLQTRVSVGLSGPCCLVAEGVGVGWACWRGVSKCWWGGNAYAGRQVRASLEITSVPASRDAPHRETNHRYFDLKRL